MTEKMECSPGEEVLCIPRMGDGIWLPDGKHKVLEVKIEWSLEFGTPKKVHQVFVENSGWFEWEYIAKFQNDFKERYEELEKRKNCSGCFHGFRPLAKCPIHDKIK